MVKIRLTRMGRHKSPFYRIVATDSRNQRDGAFLTLFGTYEPFSGKININEELIIANLEKGAQPTETVLSILKDKGIWKKYIDAKLAKVASKPKKVIKKSTKKSSTAKPKVQAKAKVVEKKQATEIKE